MAENQFSLGNLMTCFEQSLIQENDIALQNYVQAFGELSRFVEGDVADKTAILRGLHSSKSDNYASIQSMILYECFPNDTSSKVETLERVNGSVSGISLPPAGAEIKPIGPGSRTVLRLHRALNFLIEFVRAIRRPNGIEGQPAKSASELFRIVYQDTLARHHTWWVRQSVKLASHAVPNRERLLEAIFGANRRESCAEKVMDEASKSTEEDEGSVFTTRGQLSQECVDELAERFLRAMQRVYERVQRMYEENNLLELP